VAAPRSFEQFLLEGSAYIVTKFQRDGKQGPFLNIDLEHASKHLIDYPDQKIATKAIAIALKRLYTREKWAELLEAYRGWFGLVSYPDLPGNTPNNSQIVRLYNREYSLCRLALTIPEAFPSAHYTASNESRSLLIGSPDQRIVHVLRFIETSTPKPKEEKEVTPELSLINTPKETFETALFTTPRFRAKPTTPDRRIFTSDLQVEYNNDRQTWFEEISSAYQEEVEVWERECRAHKRQLLRYLDDNNIPLIKYNVHYQYHYGENYDGDEDLTEPELENEIMAAQAAAAAQKEIMYLTMLHSMQYEGTTPVEGFLKKFELARNQLMAANPQTAPEIFLLCLSAALHDPINPPAKGQDGMTFVGPSTWLDEQELTEVDTYDKLKPKLEVKFAPTIKTSTQIINKIQTIKYSPDKTVEELITEIDKIVGGVDRSSAEGVLVFAGGTKHRGLASVVEFSLDRVSSSGCAQRSLALQFYMR